MSSFQPPPTWALPILVEEQTKIAIFNPIWLKWFVDLSANLGGAGTSAATSRSISSLPSNSTLELVGEVPSLPTLVSNGVIATPIKVFPLQRTFLLMGA